MAGRRPWQSIKKAALETSVDTHQMRTVRMKPRRNRELILAIFVDSNMAAKGGFAIDSHVGIGNMPAANLNQQQPQFLEQQRVLIYVIREDGFPFGCLSGWLCPCDLTSDNFFVMALLRFLNRS